MRSNLNKENARIELAIREALENKINNKKLQEENDAKTSKMNLMNEYYNSFAAADHNKRVKTQLAEKALTYNEHFAKVALINTLTECVEKSLLLNIEEYAKLNPNYKDEIKNTITDFLENAKVNSNTNEYLVEFLEAVKNETPMADLYLTEEAEFDIVSDRILSKENINNKLDNMCRDVRARVATIVSNDQNALKDQQNDIDYVANKELEVAPQVEVQPAQDEVLADPEAEIQEPAAYQAPIDESVEVKIPTVKIIREEKKRCGIVEALTLNEATKMLNEGVEYDKTLALANTIKYLTILETLDASGLVTVGEKEYNNIIDLSQNNLPKPNFVQQAQAEKAQAIEHVENNKEEVLRNKISNILKDTLPADLYTNSINSQYDYSLFKPLKKHCEEHKEEIPHGSWTDVKGNVYTESALHDYFINQGFEETDDIESIAYSWNFRKH